MLCAMFGCLRAAVGRLTVWEYRDTAKAVKRRGGPANGLYGGFVFPSPLPCWPWAQKCRLRAIGGHTSGGKLLEDIGTWAKGNPPQESPGRAMAEY